MSHGASTQTQTRKSTATRIAGGGGGGFKHQLKLSIATMKAAFLRQVHDTTQSHTQFKKLFRRN